MDINGDLHETWKRCKRCGIFKSSSEFSRHPQTADQLFGHCRECERLRARRWRQNNPEKVRTKKIRHYSRNKRKVLARNKRYRDSHKEAIAKKDRLRKTTNKVQTRRYHRRWRERNRERVRGGQRRYWAANRERLNAENRLRYHRNRTKERERSKKYAALHPEQAKRRKQRWLLNNPEKRMAFARQRYRRNKNTILKRNRDWARRNRATLRKIKTSYRERNREKIRLNHRAWERRQIARGNHQLILSKRMRRAISRTLREGKNGRRTAELLGYAISDLWIHLVDTLPQGSRIEDFLLPLGHPSRLEIHHMVPISAFKYKTAADPDFKICWAKNNLQLVPAKDHPRGKQSGTSSAAPKRSLIMRRR
jgi:hypothetical protein